MWIMYDCRPFESELSMSACHPVHAWFIASRKKKNVHSSCVNVLILSRARRIRTFRMTESESAALPFGYSPICM